MKKILLICLIFIFSLSIFSCNKKDNNKEKEILIDVEPDGYIDEVDSSYLSECVHQGTFLYSSYPSYDYSKDLSLQNKKDRNFSIYLPYGYDENDLDTKYDILYLMHGWLGNYKSFFDSFPLKNMLDNMIENKLIKPLIIVVLTYNIDDDTKDLFKGIEEINLFHHDMINNAIPYIESNYHTYLDEISLDGIKESREHRGFGGYSLGASCTWSMLYYNHDYFSKYLTISGVLLNVGNVILPHVDINSKLLLEEENNFSNLDYQICALTGLKDVLYPQMKEFLKRIYNKKSFEGKISYYINKDGKHENKYLKQYLFYGLQILYKP